MKRYPRLTPRLDDVVHDQRRLLEAIVRGDGEAAERPRPSTSPASSARYAR
jgi:hypothetical protein